MALNLAKVYKKTKGNFQRVYEIAFRLTSRALQNPLLTAFGRQSAEALT